MRNIDTVKTREENYTICVDKVYLHSKYYPLKTAEKFIEANEKIYKSKKYVVLYGVGIGYHLKVLLDKIDNDCKVYAFDVDSEIIEKCKQFDVFKEIKEDDRVQLFIGYDENFLNNLYKKIKLVEDIIIYKPSLQIIDDTYSDIKNLLESYNLAKIGIERFGDMAKENYKSNIELSNLTLKDFFCKYNFKDKPVVIASGGPSLEDSLEILNKCRDKFCIFALGRTMDILMENGIKAHSVTIIDPQKVVYEQIKKHKNSGIPLLFLSTASKDAVESYRGEKYIFFNSQDENNKDNIIINTGKTVAVAALDIAIKGGAKTIIFVGQDLAFIDNKFHAGNNYENVEYNNTLKKVLGVNGQMLNTTSGMLEFERNIERIIETNPDVTFINCSRGARIKGTIEMELEELI